MELLALVLLLAWGAVAALTSRPFTPDPSLAAGRYVLSGLAVVAGGMLLASAAFDWWVVEDWEREATLVTRADSIFVLMIMTAVLAAAVAAVRAVWGRRDWTPLALLGAWLLVGAAWYDSTGETVDSDASGEVELGLRLATWSLLLVSATAVLGTLWRLVERRRRR